MLQLTRQYDRDNPILVGYLVSIACKNIAMDAANEALQSGSIDGKYRTALEAELSRLDNLDSCRAAMKSERAYCLDALQNDLPIGMSSFQALNGSFVRLRCSMILRNTLPCPIPRAFPRNSGNPKTDWAWF